VNKTESGRKEKKDYKSRFGSKKIGGDGVRSRPIRAIVFGSEAGKETTHSS